jgi:hypothetical protein
MGKRMRLTSFTVQLAGCALGLILAASTAFAQANKPGWIEDQTGCRHQNPSPQENEKLTWSGGCKEGYAEGEGIVEWFVDDKLVERFEGEYKHGRADGKGTLVSWQRGEERFEGEWKEGSPSKGKYAFPDGTIYAGELRDWHFHGRGERINPDGSREYGDWEKGELVNPIEK